MKIIAIMGSPKGKGSGYAMVRKVEAAMKETGDVDFEYIFLKEAGLEQCRGCFLCVSRGEQYCPIRDGKAEIERKLEEADGIILSSPGYVYNVSSLMKNFIDRFCYTNHRPKFFRQKLMLVANAGAGMEKTIEGLRNTFGAGPEIAAELCCMTPPWELKPAAAARQEQRLRKAAQRFHAALLREPFGTPKLGQYIRFRFFKEIAESVREYLPADYEYYRAKDRYYYDTSVGPLKRAAAWVAVKSGLAMMKDMGPAA